MRICFIAVALLYIISDFVVLLQSTKDVQQKTTVNIPTSDYVPTPDTWDTNPDLKSLWVYRPPSVQFQQNDEHVSRRTVLRTPHLLTRLAKPHTFGFDPFFYKAYFEPFERRQKPVTLVAFRKNGLLPQKVMDSSPGGPAEVAELQSAFNEINTFWQDDVRLIIP